MRECTPSEFARTSNFFFKLQLYMSVKNVNYLKNKTKDLMCASVSSEKTKNSLFRVHSAVS